MALNQTLSGFQTGLAPNVNLTGVPQLGTQQTQQPTISNILVGTAAPAATQRALTTDAIQRHVAAAAKAGPGTFWQVSKPTRTLKLTGALAYVNKNFPGREGVNRFVYWPDFRVAGTVSDIVSAFRQAGVQNVTVNGQSMPLTEQLIMQAALDPLNPNHRALIEQASEQTAGAPGKPKARHSLEEYILIGNALKAASKQATTAVTGGGAGARGGAGAGGRGGRSPQANQQRLVQAFNQLMTQALSLGPGQDVGRVFDVTRFDATKFTNARLVTPPKPKSTRTTAIRPVISINGRQIQVPVIAQPVGAANFAAFAQTIIAQSQYAQAAQAILQAFNQTLQQRSTAVGVQTQEIAAPAAGGIMNLLGQAQQGGFQLPPTGIQQQQLQQLPQVNQFPNQAGFQLPTANIGSGLPNVGQLNQGGFQLPSTNIGGGLPNIGGFQLPSTNIGSGLPSVGQLNQGANIMNQLGAASGSGSPLGARSPGFGATSPAPITGGIQLPSSGNTPSMNTQLPAFNLGGPSVSGPSGFSLPIVGGSNQNLPIIGGSGGFNLPMVGGQNFALPSSGGQNMFGGLPSVGGGSSAFPSVSLPSVNTGSPQ